MDTVYNVAGFVRGGACLDTSGTSCVTGSSVQRVPGTVITLKTANTARVDKLLESPGIDSKESISGGPVRQTELEFLKKSMGARNRGVLKNLDAVSVNLNYFTFFYSPSD
jgi:hypothetical protein